MKTDSTEPRKLRVLVIHTHPVQYLAPLFRRYARRDELDLTVAYCDIPATRGFYDTDFGMHTDYGVDLVGGYRSIELQRMKHGFGRLNPEVWRLVRQQRPQLVVSYGYNYPTAWLGLLAAKRFGARWVFVGDNHTIESQRGRRWFGKRLLLRTLIGVSDGVEALSVRSAAFYGQFDPDKVALVPHAIDDTLFRTWGKPQASRQGRERTVFLFVGKLIKRKRVEDLLVAAASVPYVDIRIVGSGPELANLEALAKRSLPGRVEFLGFLSQDELAREYRDADAVVLPSAIETFGLVVSEAAASDCVSIVSDSCGVAGSLVIDGVTGLTFPTGNVDELAAAMKRVTDVGFRRHLLEGLRSQYARWSPEANVDAFVTACKKFID